MIRYWQNTNYQIKRSFDTIERMLQNERKMKYKLIILIMIGFTGTIIGQKSAGERLEKYVSKYIEMEVDLNQTPGILIGLIDGDSTYTFSFGVSEKGTMQQLTDTSIFEIGSLTKVFTASLLQILVDEGRIDYQNTLSDYIDTIHLHPSLHEVTIWSLATHTSGLPRLPTNFSESNTDANNPFKYYTDADLQRFLLEYHLLQKGTYLYSQVNYVLIEKIIEIVEKEKYSEVLHRKLLEPLHLQSTTYHLDNSQKQRLTTGYLLDGSEAPSAAFSTFYGAIGLMSDMQDLIRFVRVNLSLEASPLQSSLVKTQGAQVNTGISKDIDVGIGWHIVRPKRRFYEVVSHRGTGIGHQAYIAFVPETTTAVIVLANSRHSLEGLGYFMLKMINNNWRRR